MRFKELLFRSLGFRFQNSSAWFKSFDIQQKFGSMIIRNKGSDIRVFKQIFLDEVYFFFPSNFKPNFIVDAGANVGYSAVWFSSRFPEARIIAIEPEKKNFEVLCRNTEFYPNILPQQTAIWYEETVLKIHNPSADSWAYRTVAASGEDAGNVNTVTISGIAENFSGQRIDLLKLDIEGAEFELFNNNPEAWLDLVDMIMIEIHDNLNPGCSVLIDEVLASHGFSKFITKELSIYIRK